MDNTQEAITWMQAAVENDFSQAPAARIVGRARQLLEADRPAGFSLAGAEHALAVALVEVRRATPEQIEQLSELLATFIRKLYLLYVSQGFAFPEVAVLEASRRIVISAC